MSRAPEPNEIFECPACHAKVIVSADYTCPSCHVDMRSLPDDGLRRVTVAEGAILPAVCAHCGAPSEFLRPIDSSRTLDDGGLHWFWRSLATLVLARRVRGVKSRAKVTVTVDIPCCGGCGGCAPLRPEHVNFAERRVTLLVHERLRAAIDDALAQP